MLFHHSLRRCQELYYFRLVGYIATCNVYMYMFILTCYGQNRTSSSIAAKKADSAGVSPSLPDLLPEPLLLNLSYDCFILFWVPLTSHDIEEWCDWKLKAWAPPQSCQTGYRSWAIHSTAAVFSVSLSWPRSAWLESCPRLPFYYTLNPNIVQTE